MDIKNYLPDFIIEKVYNLSAEDLKRNNIKLVLVDLDNTLIAWNNPNGTIEMLKWLSDLKKENINIIVVSNNNKERVSKAVENFGVDYIYWALKPFTFGINKAIKKFNYSKDEIVMVGDQLMTDIKAAKLAGIKSILVKPLVENDSIKTKINRYREKKVMNRIIKEYGPIEYKNKMPILNF